MNNIINKNYTYALIGASANKEKYGFKVLENLLEAGFKVIPINPKGGKILEQKVYTSINDIKQDVDVAIFVVPSQVTQVVIDDVLNKGIKKIWLQPGSENEEIIRKCEESNVICQHSACIMLEQLKYFS
jgi:predicted CoA-binding protein